MISRDDADVQAAALLGCASASPVPTVRGYLRALGQEYARAVRAVDLAESEGEHAVIVPAAAVMVGCRYWTPFEAGEVIRVANGGTGIQVAVPGAGATWENPLTSSSPVVIEL